MKNKGVDYKAKYIALRERTKETIDVAWRMGYEQGNKDAQMQAMQQQMDMQAQQQQQMTQAAQAQGHAQGHAEASAANNQQQAGGDEMDQAIGELEGIVNKSDFNLDNLEDLKKSLNKIKDSHKIKSISFMVNTTPEDKKALSTQEQIVGDILKKWEQEEASAHSSILNAIKKD